MYICDSLKFIQVTFCLSIGMWHKHIKTIQLVQKHTHLTNIYTTIHTPKLHIHTHSTKLSRPNEAIKNYLNSKLYTKALLLFANLLTKDTSLIDSYSILYVIKVCTQKGLVTEGKQIHGIAVKFGYEPIIFLRTSLINMYSSLANVADAHQMFEEIPTKNVVCWTALISAYVDNKKPSEGIGLFREMLVGDVEPDQVTYTVALSACANLGALDVGEWVHDCIRRREGMVLDLCLTNALLNMYAKCGDIGTAKTLFDSIVKKDVTTWTSMIVGYALHGQAEEALGLYAAMTSDCRNAATKKKNRGNMCHSIIPNNVTFIGVLMACSHAGLVEEGKRHFRSMTDVYGLKLELSHYGCMVDLLCRAGLLQEAYEFVIAMPNKPNAVVWRTLLGACSAGGNVELAAKARNHLLRLKKGQAGDDVAMSNVYAVTEMWDKKMTIRDQTKQRRRAPGCSSVWHQ